VVQGFFNLIHAEKHRWDTLNIANLPTNSPAWAVLEAQPGVVWEDAHSEEMACITFPENWDDFYTTAISSRRRKQQRNTTCSMKRTLTVGRGKSSPTQPNSVQ